MAQFMRREDSISGILPDGLRIKQDHLKLIHPCCGFVLHIYLSPFLSLQVKSKKPTRNTCDALVIVGILYIKAGAKVVDTLTSSHHVTCLRAGGGGGWRRRGR